MDLLTSLNIFFLSALIHNYGDVFFIILFNAAGLIEHCSRHCIYEIDHLVTLVMLKN